MGHPLFVIIYLNKNRFWKEIILSRYRKYWASQLAESEQAINLYKEAFNLTNDETIEIQSSRLSEEADKIKVIFKAGSNYYTAYLILNEDQIASLELEWLFPAPRILVPSI